MGTIRAFPGSIRPTTDSTYGDTGSADRALSISLITFSSAAPCHLKTQYSGEKRQKKAAN